MIPSGRKIVDDFINLIYPRYCLCCGRALVTGEEYICTHCMFNMPKTNFHLNRDNTLLRKFWGLIELRYALAYFKFIKSGLVQRLLHHLKYENYPELGYMIGNIYGSELNAHGLSANLDLVIPVPLHTTKLRRRGYNQSEPFAQGLSESMGLVMGTEIVCRVVKTATQTHRTKHQRWKNVQGVFRVEQPKLIENKRILLVDDIVTTGATLESCASELISAGCKEISIAAIAAAA